MGAPGRIRTCDTGFRRAVLYPLSYEGDGVSLPGGPPIDRLAAGRSPQFRDDLREGVEVVVLHGEACQPVLFAESGQRFGHLAG
jgi:hypothetical protein